jgi:hypothetical protein
MPKSKAAPKRHSAAHKAKISAGAKRAWVQRKKAAKSSTSSVPSAAASNKRGTIMPHGITVLRRNGAGKDIVECDANEIRDAVKFYREMKKRIK